MSPCAHGARSGPPFPFILLLFLILLIYIFSSSSFFESFISLHHSSRALGQAFDILRGREFLIDIGGQQLVAHDCIHTNAEKVWETRQHCVPAHCMVLEKRGLPC